MSEKRLGGLGDFNALETEGRISLNSRSLVVAKLLLLAPIAFGVYYFDLPNAYQVLLTPQIMAILFPSGLVLVLGITIKRKILRASLDVSKPSFAWGTLLLAGFVVTYLIGSYPVYNGVLRFDSLLFLIFAYVAYRIGTRVLWSISPLLGIALLSYPNVVNMDVNILYLLDIEVLLLFFVYVGMRLKALSLAAIIVMLGLLLWYHPTLNLGRTLIPSWIFLPSVFFLLVSKQVRKAITLPSPRLPPACQSHQLTALGFCSICGRKIRSSITPERFAPWGLIAVVGVAALIIVSSIPTLALNKDGAFDAIYTPRALVSSATPTTPIGWQVNSTTLYQYGHDQPYSIEKIYVPLIHPEVKNYTMYYEVAAVFPVSAGPNGGEIPGWTRLSNDLTNLGPLSGYLAVYQAPGVLKLSYLGKTPMTFVVNGSFQYYAVGVGFVREFKKTNVKGDISEFLGDITTYWLPGIERDVAYSGWTASLATLDSGIQFISQFLLIVLTSVTMVWVAYRARLSDLRLDDFLRRGSSLASSPWDGLMRLISKPGRTAEGFDFVGDGLTHKDMDVLASLEQARLIRAKIVEEGDELVMVWRASP